MFNSYTRHPLPIHSSFATAVYLSLINLLAGYILYTLLTHPSLHILLFLASFSLLHLAIFVVSVSIVIEILMITLESTAYYIEKCYPIHLTTC